MNILIESISNLDLRTCQSYLATADTSPSSSSSSMELPETEEDQEGVDQTRHRLLLLPFPKDKFLSWVERESNNIELLPKICTFLTQKVQQHSENIDDDPIGALSCCEVILRVQSYPAASATGCRSYASLQCLYQVLLKSITTCSRIMEEGPSSTTTSKSKASAAAATMTAMMEEEQEEEGGEVDDDMPSSQTRASQRRKKPTSRSSSTATSTPSNVQSALPSALTSLVVALDETMTMMWQSMEKEEELQLIAAEGMWKIVLLLHHLHNINTAQEKIYSALCHFAGLSTTTLMTLHRSLLSLLSLNSARGSGSSTVQNKAKSVKNAHSILAAAYTANVLPYILVTLPHKMMTSRGSNSSSQTPAKSPAVGGSGSVLANTPGSARSTTSCMSTMTTTSTTTAVSTSTPTTTSLSLCGQVVVGLCQRLILSAPTDRQPLRTLLSGTIAQLIEKMVMLSDDELQPQVQLQQVTPHNSIMSSANGKLLRKFGKQQLHQQLHHHTSAKCVIAMFDFLVKLLSAEVVQQRSMALDIVLALLTSSTSSTTFSSSTSSTGNNTLGSNKVWQLFTLVNDDSNKTLSSMNEEEEKEKEKGSSYGNGNDGSNDATTTSMMMRRYPWMSVLVLCLGRCLDSHGGIRFKALSVLMALLELDSSSSTTTTTSTSATHRGMAMLHQLMTSFGYYGHSLPSVVVSLPGEVTSRGSKKKGSSSSSSVESVASPLRGGVEGLGLGLFGMLKQLMALESKGQMKGRLLQVYSLALTKPWYVTKQQQLLPLHDNVVVTFSSSPPPTTTTTRHEKEEEEVVVEVHYMSITEEDLHPFIMNIQPHLTVTTTSTTTSSTVVEGGGGGGGEQSGTTTTTTTTTGGGAGGSGSNNVMIVNNTITLRKQALQGFVDLVLHQLDRIRLSTSSTSTTTSSATTTKQKKEVTMKILSLIDLHLTTCLPLLQDKEVAIVTKAAEVVTDFLWSKSILLWYHHQGRQQGDDKGSGNGRGRGSDKVEEVYSVTSNRVYWGWIWLYRMQSHRLDTLFKSYLSYLLSPSNGGGSGSSGNGNILLPCVGKGSLVEMLEAGCGSDGSSCGDPSFLATTAWKCLEMMVTLHQLPIHRSGGGGGGGEGQRVVMTYGENWLKSQTLAFVWKYYKEHYSTSGNTTLSQRGSGSAASGSGSGGSIMKEEILRCLYGIFAQLPTLVPSREVEKLLSAIDHTLLTSYLSIGNSDGAELGNSLVQLRYSLTRLLYSANSKQQMSGSGSGSSSSGQLPPRWAEEVARWALSLYQTIYSQCSSFIFNSMGTGSGGGGGGKATNKKVEEEEELLTTIQACLHLLGHLAMIGFRLEENQITIRSGTSRNSYTVSTSNTTSAATTATTTICERELDKVDYICFSTTSNGHEHDDYFFKLIPPTAILQLIVLLMGHQLPDHPAHGNNMSVEKEEEEEDSRHMIGSLGGRGVPHRLRALAFLTLGKYCLRDLQLARDYLIIFLREINPTYYYQDHDEVVVDNTGKKSRRRRSSTTSMSSVPTPVSFASSFNVYLDHSMESMESSLLGGSHSNNMTTMTMSGKEDEVEQGSVRNNALVVLGDLCVRYTHLVDRYLDLLATSLNDPLPLVRRQAVMLFISLLSQDYIKCRDSLFYRFLLLTLQEGSGNSSGSGGNNSGSSSSSSSGSITMMRGEDSVLAGLVNDFLQEKLVKKYPYLYLSHWVELFYLANHTLCYQDISRATTSSSTSSSTTTTTAESDHVIHSKDSEVLLLRGKPLTRSQRFALYTLLCREGSEEVKFTYTSLLVQEVLSVAVDHADRLLPMHHSSSNHVGGGGGGQRLTPFECVVEDVLLFLAHPSLKICGRAAGSSSTAAGGGGGEEDGLVEDSTTTTSSNANIAGNTNTALTAAKNKVWKSLTSQHLVAHTLPVLLSLKHILESRRSPLQGPLRDYLRHLLVTHKTEVQQTLASDPTLKAELEYDLKQLEKQLRQKHQQQLPTPSVPSARKVMGGSATNKAVLPPPPAISIAAPTAMLPPPSSIKKPLLKDDRLVALLRSSQKKASVEKQRRQQVVEQEEEEEEGNDEDDPMLRLTQDYPRSPPPPATTTSLSSSSKEKDVEGNADHVGLRRRRSWGVVVSSLTQLQQQEEEEEVAQEDVENLSPQGSNRKKKDHRKRKSRVRIAETSTMEEQEEEEEKPNKRAKSVPQAAPALLSFPKTSTTTNTTTATTATTLDVEGDVKAKKERGSGGRRVALATAAAKKPSLLF